MVFEVVREDDLIAAWPKILDRTIMRRPNGYSERHQKVGFFAKTITHSAGILTPFVVE